eukprot:1111253-Prorocentrum_minimum.AAC.1
MNVEVADSVIKGTRDTREGGSLLRAGGLAEGAPSPVPFDGEFVPSDGEFVPSDGEFVPSD